MGGLRISEKTRCTRKMWKIINTDWLKLRLCKNAIYVVYFGGYIMHSSTAKGW